MNHTTKFLALLLAALAIPARAQYSIDWYKVSGGGGTSTNGQYSLSGTIGQHDAGGAMTGGNYSLSGGFWAIYAVQTTGAPLLTITQSGSSAIISWPSPSTGFLLQTNGNLAGTNWFNFTGAIVTNGPGTTNSVTINPPTGKLFFRLMHP